MANKSVSAALTYLKELQDFSEEIDQVQVTVTSVPYDGAILNTEGTPANAYQNVVVAKFPPIRLPSPPKVTPPRPIPQPPPQPGQPPKPAPQPQPVPSPTIKDLGSKRRTKNDYPNKLLRLRDAVNIVENAWDREDGNFLEVMRDTFKAIEFYIPEPMSTWILESLLKELANAALAQSGHTGRYRVTKGKRGRPKKGTKPIGSIQWLRA